MSLPLATTGLSFVPADGIVLASATPATARFALLTPDFVQVQLAMTQVLSLPADYPEFKHRYGAFEAYSADEALRVLDDVRRQAAVFGNPASLAAELSQFGAGEKPAVLYGQLVWLAHRVTKTANKFRFALESLPDDLADTTDTAKRLRILQRVLTGEKGLAAAARQLEADTRALRADLLRYQPELLAAQNDVKEFFGKNTRLYREATALNPDVAARFAAVQKQVREVNEQYLGLVTTSSGALALSFVVAPAVMIPLAVVGVGAVLFDLRQAAQRGVDQLEAQLRELSAETGKKLQLVADVDALDLALPPLPDQLTAVLGSLAGLADAWAAVARQLEAIVAAATAPDLADVPAYLLRLHLGAAQQKWTLTARLTTDFTTNAFVRIERRG